MTTETSEAVFPRRLHLRPTAAAVWQWVRKHPWWSAGAVLLLALLAVPLAGRFTRNGDVRYTYHKVKRGDFLVSVVEGGQIRALKEASIRAEVEGSTKIISIVPEGTSVKNGDLLIELDSSEIEERLTSQELTCESGRFNYVQAQEALAIQKSVADSNIKEAELRLEFAKSDLQKYIEGDWPQQKNRAETAITIAAAELERVKDRLDWTTVLHKKGYATKSELQADSLTAQQKEVALSQAKEDLRLLTKYDYPKKLRSLEALAEQAQIELDRVKHRMSSQVAQAEADLASRKKTLDLQEERLMELKKQQEMTKIYAPCDGLVIYASSGGGGSYSTLIEEGATVRQKQEIIKVPDISQMVLEVRVHESNISKIAPGLTAYVTIDALPDRRFIGRVHKVSVLPDSSSRYFNPNLKVYLTEVLIEDKLPEDLKPGVSGRAEIIVTNLVNVLTVPMQAVTSVKGQQVCFMPDGAGHKAAPVEVGLYNDKFIEIKSGLKEGDEVLLSPLLAQADQIDLSGGIVEADEVEADAKAAAERAKKAKPPAAKSQRTEAAPPANGVTWGPGSVAPPEREKRATPKPPPPPKQREPKRPAGTRAKSQTP
jgi:HlyD family secretion protein